MKSFPDTPAVSAAMKAPGRMLVPGWVSIRNVSHLPPAIAISALAKAAPPFVTLVPSTMIVAPLRTPASSSVTSFTACWPPGQRPQQHRREALQRQALGTIDDRRRQVFVPQAGDPLRELAAERRHQRAASPG